MTKERCIPCVEKKLRRAYRDERSKRMRVEEELARTVEELAITQDLLAYYKGKGK